MASITYTVHGTGSVLDGMTFTNGQPVKSHPQAGECVDFGYHPIKGKEQRILVRLAGKPDLRELVEQYEAARAAEIAATPLDCDRCGAKFPRAAATWRPARIGAVKTKLPYCPDCARYLFAVEDGYGEVAGSTEPADCTPYHKEEDY